MKNIFLILIFIIIGYCSKANELDKVLKRVFDSYKTLDYIEINAKISYCDTSKSKALLHTNNVLFKSYQNQSLLKSENDLIQLYDGLYFITINIKNKHILVFKSDTIKPQRFDMGSFINFIHDYKAQFIVLSSEKNNITVGIKTPDMPNNIITYTVDTVKNQIKKFTMYKDYFDEDNRINTTYIQLDYLTEQRKRTQENIKLSKDIYTLDSNNKIVWNPRFNNYKIEFNK